MSQDRAGAIIALALTAIAGHAVAEDSTSSLRIERLDPRLDAIVAPDARIEVLADGIEWAEGPLWDSRAQHLLFSDVPRNVILRWRAETGVQVFLEASGYRGAAPFAGREPGSNGLAFDPEGRLVFCRHGERDIARLEFDGRIVSLAARYRGKRLNSPNDLVVRANGEIYFTDPPFGLPRTFDDPQKALPFQGVFRLAGDGSLTLVTSDLDAPNGLAFSPDERLLYVSNASSERPMWMVHGVREDGTLTDGRVFAEASAYVHADDGLPDGLKVDSRGHLFAAGPGGVHVFAPDGTRLGRIVTGVPTGNVALGEAGRVLFIAANHRILRVAVTP